MRERDAVTDLNLPPGFRFHPTDEELVVSYLCRKATYQCLPVPIVAEIDIYKFNPWQLPEKALFGTKEWYFFTPRDRKYPNGSRPNRAAGTGYWKATGADKSIKPIGSARTFGIKKALVFYSGKAPKGVKTNWIMHEYRLAEPKRPSFKKGSMRLDDWVLCRIYNKKNNWETIQKQKQKQLVEDTGSNSSRIIESDFDNDLFTELDDLDAPTQVPQDNKTRTETNSSSQMGKCVNEDDNWFTNLNLEDLHNFLAEFGAMPVSDLTSQDYYFSSLCSSQF